MYFLERFPSNLQSMHRYVYYNVATFTDAQLDAMMSLLQKQESETTELQGITIREAEKRDSFDCSFVVMTVWRLLGDGSQSGESKLFSSWKTKTNRVSQQVVQASAIGFLDVLSDGVYVYK